MKICGSRFEPQIKKYGSGLFRRESYAWQAEAKFLCVRQKRDGAKDHSYEGRDKGDS